MSVLRGLLVGKPLCQIPEPTIGMPLYSLVVGTAKPLFCGELTIVYFNINWWYLTTDPLKNEKQQSHTLELYGSVSQPFTRGLLTANPAHSVVPYCPPWVQVRTRCSMVYVLAFE